MGLPVAYRHAAAEPGVIANLNVRFATFRPLHGVNLRPQYGGMTSCSDEREATDCGILAGISEESGPADSCQRS